MDQQQLLGIVRHVLTFGSGFIVAKGWVDESLAAEIVTVGVGLFGVIWSVISKRKAVPG